MKNILAIIRIFWSTSLSAELEYRSNFVMSLLASLGNLAGSMFSLWLLYRGGAGFPGYRLEESFVVLALFTFLVGFLNTLLVPNLNRIVQHVETGTLDFVLLKPMDAQLWVSLRVFSPWGLPDILTSLAVLAWASLRLHTGPDAWLSLFVPLVAGAAILYALWFALATTSIWFVKIYNATEVLRGLMDAGRFPSTAFPPAYRFVFTFVVPIVFLTTVPAEAFLHRGTGLPVLASVTLACILLALTRAFWNHALRSYTSASS